MPDPDKIYDVEAEEDGPNVKVFRDGDGNVVAKTVSLNIAAEMDEGKGPE